MKNLLPFKIEPDKYVKVVSRQACPLFVSLFHRGFGLGKLMTNEVGYPFPYKHRIDLAGDVYYYKSELEEEIVIFARRYNKGKFSLNYFDRLEKLFQLIIEGLNRRTESDPQKEFARRVDLILPAVAYMQGALSLDVVLSREIKKILNEKRIPKEEVDNIIALLVRPYKKNFYSKSQEALLKLANRLAKNKKLSDELIDGYIKDFGFVDMRWGVGETLDRGIVSGKIRKIKNPGRELTILKSVEKREKDDFNDILKKLKLSKNQLSYINISKRLTYARTLRGDIFDIWFFKNQDLLSELALKMKIKPHQIKFLSSDEIIKGKVPERVDLNQREKYNYAAVSSPSGFVLSGDSELVTALQKKFQKTEKTTISLIRGIVASKGFARGVVKIIKSVKDMPKMKQGNILVSPMTTPNFISAMKKAGAIVTDEGGITCHAAIVSRELDIPCIIGTKIATKVLKDGDLVEVDANKGIVKILKRK